MKKTLIKMLIVVIVIAIIAGAGIGGYIFLSSRNPVVTVDDINYVLNSDGESYSLSGICSTNTSSEITIPGTVKNKPVTRILRGAFADCHTITGVVIPDSVNEIETEAFYNCSKLSDVTLPKGLTHFGENVFSECDLKETVSDGLVYGGVSYNDGTTNDFYILLEIGSSYNKEALVMNAQTCIIGESAFYNNEHIKSVTLSENIHTIDSYAFGYSNLENIYWNKSLITIASNAFSAIPNLIDENFYIPNTVEYVGSGAFTIGDGVTYIGSRENPKMICYVNDNEITEFTAQSKIIEICEAQNLITLSVGENVEVIRGWDMDEKALKTVSFMKNSKLKYIEGNVFSNSNISSIEIPASVSYIGIGVFAKCTQLTNVTFEQAEGWMVKVVQQRGIVGSGFGYIEVSDSSKALKELTRADVVYLYRP